MSQQRITLFFPCISKRKTSSNSRSHFLELPPDIRLRIYHQAGLVSGKMIHLNNWTLSKCGYNSQGVYREFDPRRWDPWVDAQLARSTALPTTLLAVCWPVYDELRAVLYGENRFIISRKLSRGLRALERMSDAALREMAFLTVRVNVSSCESFCCEGRSSSCGNGHLPCPNPINHDAVLNHLSNPDQLAITQWQRICAQLARSIQPGKLALYIICDCADITTAQMVVEPLLSLPTLQDCGIRLAIHVDKEIYALAEDTVLTLTRSPRPAILPYFRFFDLPKEIQLQILGFTSLVHFNTVTFGQNGPDYGTWCYKRGAVAENNDSTCVDSRPLLQCFCSSAHSAFTFSCNCKDNAFPSSFFLVSSAFRDITTRVFYTQNNFLVLMGSLITKTSIPGSQSLRLDYENVGEAVSPSGYSIIPGLANFPQSSIKLLTNIQLVFESPELEYLQPNHAGWKNWLNTIDLLSREANLGGLTLKLHFNERFYPDFQSLKDPALDSEYEGYMLETYENFIRPVSVLSGLKKLFIYLNWDTSYEVPDGRTERESMFEKIVMGENYDAWRCGKVFKYPGPLEDYYY